MSFDAARLLELLPALYRLRDEERGGPLGELIGILAAQARVLEDDLEQLHDDLFVETCAEWVLPYIGDLVGARALFNPPPGARAGFSTRAQVANTLAYRRRKGTAALLEQVARDATGWDAAVVEFFQRLATTQHMNHIRPRNLAMAPLRGAAALEWTGTAFEQLARTADVRSIATGRGRHNIPNIGIFLHRIPTDAIEDAQAFRLDGLRWLFDPLGRDLPLHAAPVTEEEISHLAGPENVPLPLGRRRLAREMPRHYGRRRQAQPGRSILLLADGEAVPLPGDGGSPPAGHDPVRACDLSDVTDGAGNVVGWAHTPPVGHVAIDPVLGRIAFPAARPAPATLRVTYGRGLAAEIGGGGYGRGDGMLHVDGPRLRVPGDAPDLATALAAASADAVVEITASDLLVAPAAIRLPAGRILVLRAADRRRPVLLPPGGGIEVTGGAGSELRLDGVLLAGALRVPPFGPDGARNGLRRLVLRHCTLAPGALPSFVLPDGTLLSALPAGPRLLLDAAEAEATFSRCILGPVRATEGARIRVADSILDAGADDALAHAAPGQDGAAGAPLVLENTTVIGRVHAATLDASGVIFHARPAPGAAPGWTGAIAAARLQLGCVRHCCLPEGARVPRPYRCVPVRAADAVRMRPVFTSLRFGAPGYAQLSRATATEIREGGEDGTEMGAFHHLHRPRREANLRLLLDEYLRFGFEAGLLDGD
jgi:hypothetical protein